VKKREKKSDRILSTALDTIKPGAVGISPRKDLLEFKIWGRELAKAPMQTQATVYWKEREKIAKLSARERWQRGFFLILVPCVG